jgi:DinB superfamily
MMTGRSLHAGLVPAFEQCEATRRDLLALLTGLASTEWKRGLGTEAWTIAEHVDHLVLAEVGTSKIVRRLIKGDLPSGPRRTTSPLFDSTMTSYPYGPGPAPKVLEPRAQPRQQTVDRLHEGHRRFIEELERFDGPDPDGIAAPDPATDAWFTLAGWVRLQALHEARHILQMKRLLAQPELLLRTPQQGISVTRESAPFIHLCAAIRRPDYLGMR